MEISAARLRRVVNEYGVIRTRGLFRIDIGSIGRAHLLFCSSYRDDRRAHRAEYVYICCCGGFCHVGIFRSRFEKRIRRCLPALLRLLVQGNLSFRHLRAGSKQHYLGIATLTASVFSFCISIFCRLFFLMVGRSRRSAIALPPPPPRDGRRSIACCAANRNVGIYRYAGYMVGFGLFATSSTFCLSSGPELRFIVNFLLRSDRSVLFSGS